MVDLIFAVIFMCAGMVVTFSFACALFVWSHYKEMGGDKSFFRWWLDR